MDNIKLLESIKERLEGMPYHVVPDCDVTVYTTNQIKEVLAYIDGLTEVIKSVNGK